MEVTTASGGFGPRWYGKHVQKRESAIVRRAEGIVSRDGCRRTEGVCARCHARSVVGVFGRVGRGISI